MVLNEVMRLIPGWVAPVMLAVIAGCIALTLVVYRSGSYRKLTGKSLLSLYFDKGSLGEYLIYKELRGYEKLGARFLFNVYIPSSEEKTSEIDVLMIVPKGIFVFESKNYSGWIFGSAENREWTQTLPNGKRCSKERFYNPVLQNRTHISNLKKLTGELPVWSVIVFSERCTLKSVNVSRSMAEVVKRSEANSAVRRILDETEERPVDVESICALLAPYANASEEVKAKHIAEVEAAKSGSAREAFGEAPAHAETAAPKEEPEAETCPLCGGRLVKRTAKRGANAGSEFMGCSNYPACRYTRAIEKKQ